MKNLDSHSLSQGDWVTMPTNVQDGSYLLVFMPLCVPSYTFPGYKTYLEAYRSDGMSFS